MDFNQYDVKELQAMVPDLIEHINKRFCDDVSMVLSGLADFGFDKWSITITDDGCLICEIDNEEESLDWNINDETVENCGIEDDGRYEAIVEFMENLSVKLNQDYSYLLKNASEILNNERIWGTMDPTATFGM